MAELNLNALYEYYIDQGLDPQTAAQYTVYYIPTGKKKGFSGITTPKFKPASQIYAEVAPNLTKFEQLNEPFWNQIIDTVKSGGTYLDLQRLAGSEIGQKYAEENNLFTPDGFVNTGALLSSAGRILNEYTNAQEQLGKQQQTFGTFAASIGAPSPDKRYSFKIDKGYDTKTQVEYAPVRKVYDGVLTKLKDSLYSAGVSAAETANYLKQFNTAFETGINAKLAESNLTPFTDYVVRKG